MPAGPPRPRSAAGGSRRAGSRAERVGHDVARDRRRHVGAGVAVLDHDRGGIARARHTARSRRTARAAGTSRAGSSELKRPLSRTARETSAPAPSRSCRPSARPGSRAARSAPCRPASLTTAHMPARTSCRIALRDAERAASPPAARRAATAPPSVRVRCGSTARPVATRADIGRELQRRHLRHSPGRCRTRRCRRRSTACPCAIRHARVGTSPVRAPGSSIGSSTPRPKRMRHRGDAVDAGAPRRLVEEHVAGCS